MSLASFGAMKVFGVKIWIILLVVLVLLAVGLLIVRKVYRKLKGRPVVSVEACPIGGCPVAHEPPPGSDEVEPDEPKETKEIEDIVKNALGDDSYTMEVKESAEPVKGE